MDEHPIERFDPLLRNLLSWGLVERSTDGEWSVRPEVAQRLDRLHQLARRPETASVVFFGHTCAGCRATRPTRLLEGRYLCDECRRAQLASPHDSDPEADSLPRRPRSRNRPRGLAS